ncbi:MAG TPA: hypothetical protein PKW73_03085 [Candidatus Obscuribacter sp.]|nr:hypothetical protein [Candidatus Obscuribacter sp.]HNA72292.1 hypothetical protein [Candidatus Obscuribacter sp.]
MSNPVRRIPNSLSSRVLVQLLLTPGLNTAALAEKMGFTGNLKCLQVTLSRLRTQGELATVNRMHFAMKVEPDSAMDRSRLENIRTEAEFWRSKARVRAKQVEHACRWIAGQAGKTVSPENANEVLRAISQIETGGKISGRAATRWLAEARQGTPWDTREEV